MTTGSYLEAGRTKVVLIALGLTAVIAFLDWSVGNTFSLGVLYIFPMMLGALVMKWPEAALLSLLCAFLRSLFDTPGSRAEVLLRFAFASVSYFVSSLFVMALVRNRRLVADHEQQEVQHRQEHRRAGAERRRRRVAELIDDHISDESWRVLVHEARRAANASAYRPRKR